MKGKTIKTNLLLIALGGVLAFGLVYLFQNTSLLQASILSLTDYKTIQENNRDMGYKTENNHIEVFCSDRLEKYNIENIVISIVYDDIAIDWGKTEYQGSVNIETPSGTETKVQVSNITKLNCKESIIDAPFVGDPQHILVNSIAIEDPDQQVTKMKIGNLNKRMTHGEE